jgi:hypothetical protein
MATSDKPIARADLDVRPPEPPVDPDMLARIDRARASPNSAVPHEAFLKEFGLSRPGNHAAPHNPSPLFSVNSPLPPPPSAWQARETSSI